MFSQFLFTVDSDFEYSCRIEKNASNLLKAVKKQDKQRFENLTKELLNRRRYPRAKLLQLENLCLKNVGLAYAAVFFGWNKTLDNTYEDGKLEAAENALYCLLRFFYENNDVSLLPVIFKMLFQDYVETDDVTLYYSIGFAHQRQLEIDSWDWDNEFYDYASQLDEVDEYVEPIHESVVTILSFLFPKFYDENDHKFLQSDNNYIFCPSQSDIDSFVNLRSDFEDKITDRDLNIFAGETYLKKLFEVCVEHIIFV